MATVGVTVTLVIAFKTFDVYDVLFAAKAGLKTPELKVKALKSALLDKRVIVTEYVLVLKFCAVTKTSIVLLPTFKAKEPDGLPLVTVVYEPLFTLT